MPEIVSNPILFSHDGRDYRMDDVVQSIRALGVERGDTIFVHSQLKFLGKLNASISKQDFTSAFIHACLESVGKTGNVIMPTFSYSFCKNEDYNPLVTPSTVGLLTEAFRVMPGVKRSLDPIFSVAAYGPDKDFYTNVGTNCIGPGSVFEKLYHQNAKIIFIGERFDLTYMHFVEYTVGVPYRYIKEFSGNVIEHGKKVPHTVQYYVRNLDINPHYALEDIANYLNVQGVLKTVPLGHSKLRLVQAQDAFEKIKHGLKVNPGLLLERNSEKVSFPS